jgi:pimeloyl-ACP methyl ester carboxylesterase
MLLAVRSGDVQGRTLRYARFGQGPPIVFLHGYPDNLQMWSAVGPLLAESFEVIAIDWPGMGGSTAWAGGATPFDMASRVIALLDHWKIDRTALVGFDMGGQAAAVAAARHPQCISHLVVSGSLLQFDARTSWEIRLLRRFKLNQFFLRHMPRLVFRRAWKTSLPPFHEIDTDVVNDFWACFRREDVRRFIIRMCAGYEGALPRLVEEYQRIHVPTLALWGDGDVHFPAVHAVRLADQVRGSKVTIITGGTHWLPLQKPEEFASEIRSFLRPPSLTSR